MKTELAESSVEDLAIATVQAEQVQDAIATLPGRQKQVLTLRYVQGLSEAEIAEALNISRGSVKTHAVRAREALRRTLYPIL